MRKARIWRAFLINRRRFSENKNGWLTTEDSNSHIPDWKKGFEISELFTRFSRQFQVGDFCSRKLRYLGTQPSLDRHKFCRYYQFGRSRISFQENSISNRFGFGSPSVDQTGSLPWVFQKQEYFQWAEGSRIAGSTRRLNREGVPNHRGRPWTRRMIDYILRNENYIGNTVYNRESFPLRGRRIKNPPGLWIRTKGSITPAIDRSIFLRAQRRLTLRWQHLTDDELLLRLKALLEKEGRLSEKIINTTLGVPAVNVYDERFGSLRNAYQRIGYNIKWDFDWIDRKNQFKELLRDTADDISDRLKKAGAVACFEPGIDVLTVNDRFAISFRLARSWRGTCREPIWTINRRVALPDGYIIAIRLGDGNKDVLDYFLLPTTEMIGAKIRFTEAGLHRFDGRRFRTSAHLTKAVLHQIVGRTQKGKPEQFKSA